MSAGPHWLERIGILVGISLGLWGVEQGCDANNLAQKAIELQAMYDLRPYVWIEWQEKQVDSTSDLSTLSYKVVNTGKSPALRLKSRRSAAFDKWNSMDLRGASDIYGTLYPGQHSWYSAKVNFAGPGTSLYFHSIIVYEFSVSSADSEDSVNTVFRFETIKIDPLADNGFQLTSIGSDEQFVKGKVVDCKIKFEHPDYYLEDIVHSTDKSLSTE